MASILVLLAVIATVTTIVNGDGAVNQRYGPDVMRAAEFAIGFHNRMSNYPYAYKVISVISENSQIYPPARMKYTMTVKVGETTCKNTDKVNLTDCRLQTSSDAKAMICQFVVLAVPNASFPTNSYLLSNKCN
ncbi:cystatin [Alosa alosa]|nr:cystatin [Alosa sapidissima]XP_048104012.1 cystatin [Alosa alosa]